jgi:hypothetical protein
MRRVILAAVVACCVVSIAQAQFQTPSTREECFRWIEGARANDERNYDMLARCQRKFSPSLSGTADAHAAQRRSPR